MNNRYNYKEQKQRIKTIKDASELGFFINQEVAVRGRAPYGYFLYETFGVYGKPAKLSEILNLNL